MIWCVEDSADVEAAVAALRSVADALAADAKRKQAGPKTRERIEQAVRCLVDLRDVYYDEKAPRP